MLKEKGYVNGAGAYFYFEDRTDFKFSQKAFKSKLAESAEFREIFANTVSKMLMTLINDPGEQEIQTDENVVDISSYIYDRMSKPVAV